jgi:hypothetical protein
MRSRHRGVILVVACGLIPATVAVGFAPQGSARHPLAELPAAQFAKCRVSTLLRPVCPHRVPRVRNGYRALFARDGTLDPPLHVFDLERFAPTLRPPAGAHITAAAGAVWRLTPYADPTARTRVVPITRPTNVNRAKPVSFGVRRWNGRRGILYLAPPYVHGGQLGDHMVFQWQESGKTYVISLHTWWPLQEVADTLKQMVEAL